MFLDYLHSRAMYCLKHEQYFCFFQLFTDVG